MIIAAMFIVSYANRENPQQVLRVTESAQVPNRTPTQ
jgi:hypothetical protein